MMFIEKIINSIGKFISLMIPVMTLLMIVIIVARYSFGIGLTGLQEFVMYIHALVFLGCAGYVHYKNEHVRVDIFYSCLLYTSPSPRDKTVSRMPSSA